MENSSGIIRETSVIRETGVTTTNNIAKQLVENAILSIPGNTLQKKLDYLALCNCCERHQKNKPKKLRLWFDNKYPTTQYTNCNCNCRHIARFICREIG